jgi:hypothetical protein
MPCRYVAEWDCHIWPDNLSRPANYIPSVDKCEFCKSVRLMYISNYMPLAEDYAKNLRELHELRLKVKALENSNV